MLWSYLLSVFHNCRAFWLPHPLLCLHSTAAGFIIFLRQDLDQHAAQGGLGLAAQASCLLLWSNWDYWHVWSRSCILQGLEAVVERALVEEGYACASVSWCWGWNSGLSALGKNSPTELSPELFLFHFCFAMQEYWKAPSTVWFPGAFRWIMIDVFLTLLGHC